MSAKMEDFYEMFAQYGLNNENYKKWRKEHTKMFGKIFSDAFSDFPEGEIHLTAALINIAQREFDKALPKLELLVFFTKFSDYDKAAVLYFKGLTHELLGNEAAMTEDYEKLRETGIRFCYPLAFHPYYRTAKLLQRESMCQRSVAYYQKALAFYENTVPDKSSAPTVSAILYDIATVSLYRHQYADCEHFLSWSRQYDSGDNQQRQYVSAILSAALGKREECERVLATLNPFFKSQCEPLARAILAGSDLHYCEVKQERSGYGAFWRAFEENAEELLLKIKRGEIAEAEKALSELLSKTLSFARRTLSCRIVENDGTVTVFCMHYCIKTLIAEYEALFAEKPDTLPQWQFIPTAEFESR